MTWKHLDTEPAGPLIFDTMVLSHCALADRLDVLGDLVLAYSCATTTLVWDELRTGAAQYPSIRAALTLDWIRLLALDEDHEHRTFKRWVKQLGSGDRGQGEASVFAAAEEHGGIAVTDGGRATQVGRRYGLAVHGTVWLLAQACSNGKLTETNASALIEALRATGHRLPCTGSEFPNFVRRHGLL